MNKVLMSLLFGAFLLTGSSYAQSPAPTPAPAAAPAAAPVAEAPETVKPAHHAGHHPEIHKAMRKLRAAKEDLQKITHDLGGHRSAAIGYIDQAIGELKAAMDSDKK